MPTTQLTVLLVDDDPQRLGCYARLLEEAGCRVIDCADPNDALDVLETDTHVDVLVTEVMMPGKLNGFALGRMSILRRRNLKIVYFTSALEQVPQIEIESALGVILGKPASAAELLRAIEQSLAGMRAPAQEIAANGLPMRRERPAQDAIC